MNESEFNKIAVVKISGMTHFEGSGTYIIINYGGRG